MAGYNENQGERTKTFAELLRISTSLLWNIQVGKEDKLKPVELWPLPWDERPVLEKISDEEYQRRMDKSAEILNNYFPDGDSNIKS